MNPRPESPSGARFEAYLPRVLTTWAPAEGRARTLDGSLLFVDVSGFTALSERLASRGREGAEELTAILDTRFTELLSLAYVNGGSMLKYGGDALLLLFEDDDHAERACDAALRMRHAMRTAGTVRTTAGPVRLRLSAGVHSDELHLFRVGTSHAELLVTGPPATKTVAAESAAAADTIVVSERTARAIPASWRGERSEQGVRLVHRRLGPALHGSVVRATPAFDLRTAIPTALRQALADGSMDGEHRTASIAFLRFSGVDRFLEHEGAERVADALHTLVSEVQAACDANGVTFLGSDLDRDGGKIILLTGAPKLLGDDEDRMLRAVHRINSTSLPLPLAIGVHRGHVFAGELGPGYRRTYTVIGDAVNLAARLMSNARPGAVLVTDHVLERSRTRFSTEPVPPFLVKGRAQPVEPRILGDPLGERLPEPDALPLIGRDAELAELDRLLTALRSGAGARIALVGDTGIGKSRLLRELRIRATDVPMRIVTCEPYASATPFFAFRVLLRALLDLPASEPVSPEQLHAALDATSPQLAAEFALLADVVGVPSDPFETEATRALAPRYRRERTALVVRDLLLLLHPDPSILAFDDVQHIDDVSRDLLAAVVAATSTHPLLLVTTIREPSDAMPVLTIGPLDTTSAQSLLTAVRGTTLPPHRLADIMARANGNPFFLEMLAHAAPEDDDEVPATLESVIGAEIDALSSNDRSLLRHAAVLGATFERSVLEQTAALPPGGADAVIDRLGRFLQQDARGVVRFRHRLHRDTAYAGLPFARRRELHARAGVALEDLAGLTLDVDAGLETAPLEMLSLHFEQANDVVRTVRYGLAAAERARDQYANVEAVALYERTVRAAKRSSDLETGWLGAVLRSLGDVAHLAGFYARADGAYRAGLAAFNDAPAHAATIWLRRARLASRQGRTAVALRRAMLGLRAVGETPGEFAGQVRADLNVLYAWMRQQQGKPHEAIKRCRLVLEEGSDPRAMADALLLLDWISLELGRPEEATNADRAIALLEQLGAFEELAVAANNLGGYAYFQSQWEAAIDRYAQARDAFSRIGDTVHVALANANIAEIRIDQGRLDEADTMLTSILELWQAMSFEMGVAIARTLIARLQLRRGEAAAARASFTALREDFIRFDRPAKVIEIDAWIAESELSDGDPTAAIGRIDDALRRQRASGGTEMTSMLHRVRALALERLDRPADAALDAEHACAAAQQRGSRFELALAQLVAARLPGSADTGVTDLVENANAALAELGVIANAYRR